MSRQRYFLEVFYKGTHYSGFQVQENANSVQAEIEKAFLTLQKQSISLTGSSRTDAGVHAMQNFFHFDFDDTIHHQFLYKINAILPRDIVIKNIYAVAEDAHSRFDAVSRTYHYYVYRSKNPFLEDRAFYFPYKIDMVALQKAADLIKKHHDFTSFSKRNTQVKTFLCNIIESQWTENNDVLIYRVKGNRFLRCMVRGLVGTMLRVGTGKISVEAFNQVIEARDCTKADFSVPGHGLTLENVEFPPNLLMTALPVN